MNYHSSAILTTIILICLLLISNTLLPYALENVLAQSTEITNFQTYDNTLYRFKIKYPSDWNKIENDPNRNSIIAFVSTVGPDPRYTGDTAKTLSFEVGIMNLPQGITTIPSLTDFVIATSQQLHLVLFEFGQGDDITAQGYPAHWLEFSSSKMGLGHESKELMYYTIINGKVYFLSYYVPQFRHAVNVDLLPNNYIKYLPIIREMIKSFNVYSDNNSPPTATITSNNDSRVLNPYVQTPCTPIGDGSSFLCLQTSLPNYNSSYDPNAVYDPNAIP